MKKKTLLHIEIDENKMATVRTCCSTAEEFRILTDLIRYITSPERTEDNDGAAKAILLGVIRNLLEYIDEKMYAELVRSYRQENDANDPLASLFRSPGATDVKS